MLSIFCILSIVTIHGLSGGNAASEGQYQASLQYRGRHFCGGSVIGKRWILTASHCLSGFNDTAIDVVLGTNTLGAGGNKYSSIKKWIHPSYNSALKNDIGLIELDRDIDFFGDKVKPIKLPTSRFKKSDSAATLSGWGTTTYSEDEPNELQHIQLQVLNQKRCLNTSFRITNKNICALNERGEGAYRGHSGGPLVAGGKQIGIASWGVPRAKKHPDVFTRVYPYVDWINKHIEKDNKKKDKLSFKFRTKKINLKN